MWAGLLNLVRGTVTKTIDLIHEFSGLSGKEEMMAFFEFRCVSTGAVPVHGLCKIARPVGSESTLNYIGLSFVFDIEDQKGRDSVDASMNLVKDVALKKAMPTFEYSISGPIINPDGAIYIKELDLVFRNNYHPDREFIENDLVPALCAIAKLENQGVTLWGDDIAPVQPAILKKPGFIERLRQALSVHPNKSKPS